ncbi:unnamed protein product [Protopolystoma xenopodis]|uniref:Uncharacterized protein n=1 Tax=Protopolystoma xenopodis TaxID=117903 RepID=A0A448X4L6_9PLAT|nr:unnamed protein product [Protopolystoma xenopodis]
MFSSSAGQVKRESSHLPAFHFPFGSSRLQTHQIEAELVRIRTAFESLANAETSPLAVKREHVETELVTTDVEKGQENIEVAEKPSEPEKEVVQNKVIGKLITDESPTTSGKETLISPSKGAEVTKVINLMLFTYTL